MGPSPVAPAVWTWANPFPEPSQRCQTMGKVPPCAGPKGSLSGLWATLEPWGKGAERSKRVLHYFPGPRAGGQTGPSPMGHACAQLAPPMQKPLLSVLRRSDVTVTSTSASRCICLFPLTVGSLSWGCQRAKCPWVGSLNTGHVLSQRWRLEGAASPQDPLLGLHLAAFSPCPNFLWRVHS